MANARFALTLSLVLAVAIVPYVSSTSNVSSSRNTRSSLYEHLWLQLLSENAHQVAEATKESRAGGGWSPKLISLPLGEGKQSVPLLVLPVQVQSESDTTKDYGAKKSKNEEWREVHEEAYGPRIPSPSPSLLLQPPTAHHHKDSSSKQTPTFTYTYSTKENEDSRVFHEDDFRQSIPSFLSPPPPVRPPTGHRHDQNHLFEQTVLPSPPAGPPRPPSPKTENFLRQYTENISTDHINKYKYSSKENEDSRVFREDDIRQHIPSFSSSPPAQSPIPISTSTYTENISTDHTKTAKYMVIQISRNSRQLVEFFRRQTPTAPELPPAVIPRFSELIVNHTTSWDVSESSWGRERYAKEDPPRPRFDRSLFMKAKLTVYRADYTEPYAVWWDAATGRARVDYHTEDGTSTFRQILPDGRLQYFEMHVDRTEEQDVTRCSRGSPRRVASRHLSHPALPQIELFTFDGFDVSEGVTVERWRHVIRGGPGEYGGALGEALTFHHELLLRRTSAHYAAPVKYTVSVDSSVLGSDCDGYEHRYLEVRKWQPQDEGDCHLSPNESDCDVIENLDDVAQPEHRAKLDPLHEFTLPTRDPRYDAAIEDFKVTFSRQYVDYKEEAVRKNLFIQSSRFVNSGNREGATFEMEVNFFSDRLDVENKLLLGVALAGVNIAEELFPHSEREVKSRALPRQFDWRREGAVTPVRSQGESCMSCWAFAITAAVEGALFRVTRRLVPLSEKAIVDCGHKTGAHGCNPTWPRYAYDYVQYYGLPAREQYPDYNEKVDSCSASHNPPVTNISSHVEVSPQNVPALKVAIKDHGPTVVIINLNWAVQHYKKGVLIDKRCERISKPLMHAVTAVGWGTEREKTHLVLKNSWGQRWGERGYVRVFAASNTCGVLTRPSYPRLEPHDVHPSEPARATVAPDPYYRPTDSRLTFDSTN